MGISLQICTPAGATGLLIGRLGLCRSPYWSCRLSSEGVQQLQTDQIALRAVFVSLRFAADGGYSGPEYDRADNLPGPVSLVGLLEKNESSVVSRHTCSE